MPDDFTKPREVCRDLLTRAQQFIEGSHDQTWADLDLKLLWQNSWKLDPRRVDNARSLVQMAEEHPSIPAIRESAWHALGIFAQHALDELGNEPVPLSDEDRDLLEKFSTQQKQLFRLLKQHPSGVTYEIISEGVDFRSEGIVPDDTIRKAVERFKEKAHPEYDVVDVDQHVQMTANGRF